MILALAALLLQPAIPQAPVATVDVAALIETTGAEPSATPSSGDIQLPVSRIRAGLADAPAADRVLAAYAGAPEPVAAPETSPIVLPKPAPRGVVSVAELLVEGRRNRRMFVGLGIAAHSAAAFDAWTTRRAISAGGAREVNPLLRPFAGNASLYAAIQVGPTIMDYVGGKMMYSRHRWLRRMWWLPQAASMASSLVVGGRNLHVAGAN